MKIDRSKEWWMKRADLEGDLPVGAGILRDNDLKRRIRVNNQKVWLDEDAYARGQFRVARDTMGEQCSDCGKDIEQTGKLEKAEDLVRCSKDNDGCGTFYRIEQLKD
jgi:hypothetical protein